ncbi:MAG: hypothetical protein HY059_11065, partial [Proteobacteria bacterium]|nr:hypothetical protein [Pseudomonadota bacterium]
MTYDRRSLLRLGGGTLAATLVPGGAWALRVEEMDVPRQRLLLSACETRTAHERVIDDLMRQIEGTGVDAGKARAQVAAMSCPFCGCNLAAVSAQIDGEP